MDARIYKSGRDRLYSSGQGRQIISWSKETFGPSYAMDRDNSVWAVCNEQYSNLYWWFKTEAYATMSKMTWMV